IRISSTVPTARASAQSPSNAIGSNTSCTQRGTTTGGGGGGAGGSSGPGGRWATGVSSGPGGTWAASWPSACSGSNEGGGRRGGGDGAGLAGGQRSLKRIQLEVWAHDEMTDHREDVSKPISILFAGDIVGGIGRRTLLALLPSLRERCAPDFVVVNGENAAAGMGITPKIADQLFAAGVDVITLGNHTYRQREIYSYLDTQDRILRPANFLRSQPGHGWCVVTAGEVR